MSLGLLEEATAFHAGWLNERIVAVCAAGLVAGPWVGLAVSLFVTRPECLRLCSMVSRRAPRPPVRLHRTFYVARWFGRRVAVPLAPEVGSTPADGILSNFGGIVAAEYPHLLACSSFVRGSAQVRGNRNGPSAARFGHGIDSGYRQAGT